MKDSDMDSPEDREFQRRAHAALRDSEQEIDLDVRERLSAARRQAVIVADKNRAADTNIAADKNRVADNEYTSWLRPWSIGLGGSAAAAVLMVAVFVGSGEQELPPLDLDEFAVAQDAELLEDLEFVAWMLALETDSPSGETGAANDSLRSS